MKKYNIPTFQKSYKKTTIYQNIHDTIELTNPLQKLGLTYFALLRYSAANMLSCLISSEDALNFYANDPNMLYSDPYATSTKLLRSGVYYSDVSFSHLCSFAKYKEKFKGFVFIEDNPAGCREIAIFHFTENSMISKENCHVWLRPFLCTFKDKADHLINNSDTVFIPSVYPGTTPITMPATVQLCHGNCTEELLSRKEYNYCKTLQVATMHNLSHREAQCLNLLLQGNLNKQTAGLLGLSQRTIEAYTNNIKYKLGCHNKLDVVRKTLDFNFESSIIESINVYTDDHDMRQIHHKDSLIKTGYNYDKCLQASKTYNLSLRESQCLGYILEGKLNKQIAYLLNLSPKTIEVYVNNLKNKLDCRTKTEIIIKTLL